MRTLYRKVFGRCSAIAAFKLLLAPRRAFTEDTGKCPVYNDTLTISSIPRPEVSRACAVMSDMHQSGVTDQPTARPGQTLSDIAMYSGSQKYLPTLQAVSATPSLVQSG